MDTGTSMRGVDDDDDDNNDPGEMAQAFFNRGMFHEGAAVLKNASASRFPPHSQGDCPPDVSSVDVAPPLMLMYELCVLCQEHEDAPSSIEAEAQREVQRLRGLMTTRERQAQEEIMRTMELEGDALVIQHAYEPALDAFEDCLLLLRAISVEPPPVDIVRLLNKAAIALHRMGDHDSAKVRLEAAATYSTDLHDTYAKLWKVYANLGLLDKMEATLLALIDMGGPHVSQHRRDYAESLHRRGNIDGALAVFETLEPTAITLAYIARALCDKKCEEDALKKVMEATESPSRNAESQLVVAQVYRRLLKPEEALRVYDSIVPASALTLHGKGLCFVAMQKFDDALITLMDARAMATAADDDDDDDLEMEIVDDIGAVYHALGDEERALEYYLIAHGEEEDEGVEGEEDQEKTK